MPCARFLPALTGGSAATDRPRRPWNCGTAADMEAAAESWEAMATPVLLLCCLN
jgi:hypothetical protein